MSIALKYWAFQQTGWGHVDESVPVSTPEPTPTPVRSDADGGQFPLFPVRVLRPPAHYVDPGFPQSLRLFDRLIQKISVTENFTSVIFVFDYLRSVLTATEHVDFSLHASLSPLVGNVSIPGDISWAEVSIFGNTHSAHRAHVSLNLLHQLGTNIEGYEHARTTMAAWDATLSTVDFLTAFAESFRPYTYGTASLETPEDDLEQLLPAIIAKILEGLPFDQE